MPSVEIMVYQLTAHDAFHILWNTMIRRTDGLARFSPENEKENSLSRHSAAGTQTGKPG